MKTIAAKHFLVPWALFAGVLASFVACCVAGRETTKKHHLVRFTRFHHNLCPESMFYPTASHVQRLGMARTKKDRINVIIGGSSILNGTGQQAHELWTDKLAEILGPQYRVLNLAFRAGQPGEVGAIGAEMLMDRRRVIFVTDMAPGGRYRQPDGNLFRYFFWDAWYKGLIDREVPDRAACVAGLDNERASDPKFPELLHGARMNSALYFNDLWNTLAYTEGGTVWNLVTQSQSFSPRIRLQDPEPAPLPVEQRLQGIRRNLSTRPYKGRVLDGSVSKDISGAWVPDPTWLASLRQGMRHHLPNEVLRQRTIVIIDKPSPLAFQDMTADELDCWSAKIAVTAKVLEEIGMHPLEMETMTGEEDYSDLIHLAGKGGEKLAIQLAPAIRELTKSLGYDQPGTGTRSSKK